MNRETKPTAALHFPTNTTVATAVLAKLCTAAQLSGFVPYFLVADISQYKMISVENF